MRLYSLIHCPGEEIPLVVKEGFSWLAFLFGPLWLAWHRLWAEAAIAGGLWLLSFALPPLPSSLAQLALFWLIGLEGNGLRRAALLRKGCYEKAIVPAHDAEEALLHALPAEG
jgi:hypothetical protein